MNINSKGSWLDSLGNKALKKNLQKQWGAKQNNAPSWVINRLENKFRDLEANIPKNERPILSLISSGTDHYIIAADFDRLGAFSNFSEIFREVDKLHCVTAFSASGNVKAFFPVRYAGKMTAEIALVFLEERLTPALLSIVDRSYSALFTTRLTTSIIDTLSKQGPNSLRSIRPIEIETSISNYPENHLSSIVEESNHFSFPIGVTQCTPGRDNNNEDCICNEKSEQPPPKSDHTFNISEVEPCKEVSELQFWLSKDPNKFKTLLLKILLAMTGLLNKSGFGLPTHKLAKEIGCSVNTVAKHLRFLREKGLLEIIDHTFRIGVKAITYVAKKGLREAISRVNTKAKNTHVKMPPPGAIEAGNWNRDLWYIQMNCFHLHQYEEFRTYALALPGSELRDRRKKIQKIYEKMQVKQVSRLAKPTAKYRPDKFSERIAA